MKQLRGQLQIAKKENFLPLQWKPLKNIHMRERNHLPETKNGIELKECLKKLLNYK